jgi:hypothetical protein
MHLDGLDGAVVLDEIRIQPASIKGIAANPVDKRSGCLQ